MCGKSSNLYFATQQIAEEGGYPHQGSYCVFNTNKNNSWWFELSFHVDTKVLYFRSSVNGTISSWRYFSLS